MPSSDVANLTIALASLAVALASSVYTALSYYEQRKPLGDEQKAILASTRRWRVGLVWATAGLLAVGLLDILTSLPERVVSIGYGVGLAAALVATIGRWKAAHGCRIQFAHERAEQLAAAQASAKRQLVETLNQLLAGVDSAGKLPRVGDEALPKYERWIGVARSRYTSLGADPYIPRPEADEALDQALEQMLRGHGWLVLTVGPSKAGKTRSALEALRRHSRLGEASVLSPRPGRLADLARFDPPLQLGRGRRFSG